MLDMPEDGAAKRSLKTANIFFKKMFVQFSYND